MRSIIKLPVNTSSTFFRGTTGEVLAAPDPVNLSPADRQITVTWAKNTLAEGYRVFYSTSPITDVALAGRISITDPDDNSTIITNLKNGITYYVRVVSVNGAGYSPLTTEVSAVPSLYTNALSCRFDGTTEYAKNVTTSDFDFLKTDPFTISLWVKFDVGEMAGDRTFISNMNVGFNYEGIEFHKTATNDLRFYFSKVFGSDRIICTWGGVLTENVWQHVCLTYDGSNAGTGVKAYVNASLQSRTINQAGPISGTMNSWGNWTVGAREDGSKLMKGWIDELAIYNDDLTGDEIIEIYNAGSPCKLDSLSTSGPKLISWWRMGDNDISTTMYDVYDSNNLTTVNMDTSNYQAEVP